MEESREETLCDRKEKESLWMYIYIYVISAILNEQQWSIKGSIVVGEIPKAPDVLESYRREQNILKYGVLKK